VKIAAFLPEKSAIKNFEITKPYRQRTPPTLKVREVLSWLELFVTMIKHCPSHRVVCGKIAVLKRNARSY
jgi:hypothetical protein